MYSARHYIDTAKEEKKLLSPLLWIGFGCMVMTPVLLSFNWILGAIWCVSSLFCFIIRRFLAGRVDKMYELAVEAQKKAEEKAILDAERAILYEKRQIEEEATRKRWQEQKAIEAEEKRKKEAERKLRLEQDPYCELPQPEKLILSVVSILYKVGMDIYSRNTYDDHLKEINDNLTEYNMKITKLDNIYLHVKLFQNDGEDLTFILIRSLDTDYSVHNHTQYYICIKDQYDNILYKELKHKFNKRNQNLLTQIKNNWSDNILAQKAYDILSSIIRVNEEKLSSRLLGPVLEDMLESIEKDGLNG